MLGHDYITDQLETIFLSDFAKNLDEQVSISRRAQQWKPMVTTEGQKVKMTECVDTLEIFRHGRKAKSPTLTKRAWGTRNNTLSS